jgi:aryl-alcohol dehydrogenase-like predicted oxidoreductase
MDYRQLGRSGLKVSALSFGTATFGGGTEFFRAWGQREVEDAKRLVDICLEAGINLFDTADVYSNGISEEILGKAVAGKRQNLLISTNTTFRLGEGPNEVGSSRYHISRAICSGVPSGTVNAMVWASVDGCEEAAAGREAAVCAGSHPA